MGKLTLYDGLVIEGSWKKGEITGFVSLKQPNGDQYEGNMVDGKRHGKGTTKYESGDKFEGNFINDKRTGFGLFVGQKGHSYSGNWENGKMSGKFDNIYPSLAKKYDAYLYIDDAHGYGKISYPDGGFYNGEWTIYFWNKRQS